MHGGAVAHGNIVLLGAEQAFIIPPGRAQQERSTGHGLKHPDGRNAAQAVGILPPRNVQRDPGLVIGLGRTQVRQVSAELNIGVLEARERCFRIANAVGHELQIAELLGGLHQKFFHLAGALIVTPVTDP